MNILNITGRKEENMNMWNGTGRKEILVYGIEQEGKIKIWNRTGRRNGEYME